MLGHSSDKWTKEALRSLRLRLGWSRSDLARRLKCTCEEVEKWEEGLIQLTAQLQGELDLILGQANACSDEVKYGALAEEKLDHSPLEQIEFSQLKNDLE